MDRKSRLVVIGGVAAGMSAASKARRMDPEMEIVVYEKSGYVSYGACGLPYYVQGIIAHHTGLLARPPEHFAKQGIQVFTHHEVTRIDPQRMQVEVRNLDDGTTFTTAYDHLMLSTGGYASQLLLDGLDPRASNVFSVRTVEDGVALRNFIERERPKRAVIAGGGYIGLEMAEALHVYGIHVTVLMRRSHVLPNLDPDMAVFVQEELDRQGVDVHLSHEVRAVEGQGGRVTAVLAGDAAFPADLAVMALGVRPATALAEPAGIALGRTGAVAVDDHQRTNVPSIYAGGDVAEAYHRVLRQPVFLPLGTTANKQGRVAGENIAGGDASFPGIVGTEIVKVFDLGAARTGLTETEARLAGFEVRSTRIKARSRSHYYPGSSDTHVKLVYQPDGKLLGAQIVGADIAKRIDVLAAALQAGWTIDDLAELDLSYAPPFAPVWDPVLVAANVAQD